MKSIIYCKDCLKVGRGAGVGAAKFELDLTTDERRSAEHWLKGSLPAGINRLVGFGPGSKWPSKIWPEERFAELGSLLLELPIFFRSYSVDRKMFSG